jgi:hypothetical protein
MTDKNVPTFPVVLSGKEYALRFDLDAQVGTVTTCKIINPGFQNLQWWRFLDAPYDIGEMVALLLHGINGARRFAGEKKLMKIDEVKELLEEHFDTVYGEASEIEDDEEAMKYVQNENQKLFSALQDAARAGVGFRKSRPKMTKPKEESSP